MSYYSSFFSPYHSWFEEMGYPQLDICQFEDGEWSIIEIIKDPLVPSMTKFRHILMGMRNVEMSRSFVEKYIAMIDSTKRFFWEREEAKTNKMLRDKAYLERSRAELIKNASKFVTNNPDLLNRVAKNGIKEILPDRIARNLSDSALRHNFGIVRTRKGK